MSNPKKTRYNRGQKQQDEATRNLDDLAFFDEFFNKIAPQLRKMIVDGKTATEIYKIGESQMAARILTIALTEKDPKVVMAAIKEAHDRSLGKAKETLEVNNRYEAMSDEDIDRQLREQEEALEDATAKH